MDVAKCYNNASLCDKPYTSVPCSRSLIESHCMQYYDICFINTNDSTRCLCSLCFTGDHCEKELSNNLWQFGMLFNEKMTDIFLIDDIVGCTLGIFVLFNGILCLQTYLCRKIRQTNLGIYLIILSIISIFMGLSHFISCSINLYFTRKKLKSPVSLDTIFCCYQKYIYALFLPMFNWLTVAVAVERVLVECSIKYGLYDSRRRSVIYFIIIVVVCGLSTIPGIFTVRDTLLPNLQSFSCLNFTYAGYIIYLSIRCIHLCAFYFIYILMNVIVLIKLIRRRQRFIDNNSLLDQSVLILSKHKDFFVPYLIQAICQLPYIVMNYTMTCSRAASVLVIYIHLICNALQFFPFALIFYLYVNLSPVYISIFWDSSPMGKFLLKINGKIKIVYENRVNHNTILMETYT